MNNRATSGGDRDRIDGCGILLEVLDPGHSDPGYWGRFQDRVLALAAPELARRRATPQPTVGDVLASWWRLLVPASVAAASAIAALSLPEEPPPEADIAIEEALLTGFDDEPLPTVLAADRVDEVAFLAAIEGP